MRQKLTLLKDKKPVLICLTWLMLFLFVCFLPFTKALAVTYQPASACQISVSWGNSSATAVGSSNTAIATFTNCVSYAPFINWNSTVPNQCIQSNLVGLGANISSSPATRNATITFCQPGDYAFSAFIQDSSGSQYGTAFSSHINNLGAGGGTSFGCPVSTGASGPNGLVWACDDNAQCGNIPSCNGQCQQISQSQCSQPVSNGGNGAQSPGTGGAQSPTGPGGNGAQSPGNSGIPCTGMQCNSQTTLYNPLPEEDLVHTFLLVAQGFLAIMGVVAVTFIIIGGFQMVISAGNEEAILKAKKTILWAILGMLAALLSFSVIAIVQDLLQANIKPSSYNNEQQIKNV